MLYLYNIKNLNVLKCLPIKDDDNVEFEITGKCEYTNNSKDNTFRINISPVDANMLKNQINKHIDENYQCELKNESESIDLNEDFTICKIDYDDNVTIVNDKNEVIKTNLNTIAKLNDKLSNENSYIAVNQFTSYVIDCDDCVKIACGCSPKPIKIDKAFLIDLVTSIEDE